VSDHSDDSAIADPVFAPPAHPADLGTLGKYRVLKLLGKGGMGAVYLGYHSALQRKVALKVMLPRHAANPIAWERFLREARAAANVKSDHVVTIYDVGEEAGTPFIAMECLQGKPLDDYLRARGIPTVAQAVRIGREVAAGLAAAHAMGLIHRDVKPGNLWLEAPRGRVKILDFGLARQLLDDAPLTHPGRPVGTPAYMSPEQARGLKVDPRTDLFSLGGVLYRLLAGRLPFPGSSPVEVLARLALDEPTPLSEMNPEVPEPLAALVHQLLAKDPAGRPAAATAVAAALRELETSLAALAPIKVSAQPESLFAGIDESSTEQVSASRPPVVRPKKLKGWAPAPRAWLAGGLVAGLLLAVAAGVVWRVTRPGPEPPVEPAPVTTGARGKPSTGKSEPQAPPAGPTFFNGRDLSGWVGAPGHWRVENGALLGSFPEGVEKPAHTWLYTDRTYTDFELALQARCIGNGPGVHFRSSVGKKANRFSLIGPALVFGPGGFGALTGGESDGPLPRRTGIPGLKIKPGEFNDLTISCAGKRLRVTVNGTVALDEDCELPPEGIIGLRLPAGADEVSYRNIQLRDPRPAAAPD
jgi:serine/threonine protein kinase